LGRDAFLPNPFISNKEEHHETGRFVDDWPCDFFHPFHRIIWLGCLGLEHSFQETRIQTLLLLIVTLLLLELGSQSRSNIIKSRKRIPSWFFKQLSTMSDRAIRQIIRFLTDSSMGSRGFGTANPLLFHFSLP